MVQGTIDQFTISQLEDLIETLVEQQHPPRIVLDWNMGNLYPGFTVHSLHIARNRKGKKTLFITYINAYSVPNIKQVKGNFEKRTLFNILNYLSTYLASH